MYVASLNNSENYKAQPYQYASPSKHTLKAKAKPCPLCTHYGFNNHRPDDCHNCVILVRGGVIVESSQSSKSSVGVSCTTCESNVHSVP
ncbi:hypothetical protein Tco_0810147 [Tanacetum coccineum]